ncbi:MAG: hypothetical protein JWO36_951 [Myxococcales bacterium]|nr:hypothetical protein [Myxococcales bacterium]
MIAPPPAAPAPIAPWILREGTLRFDATLELGMSSGRAAKPIAIAPDLWVGVSPRLTLGLVHSRYATTGFRGSAGGGLCVTATTGGCAKLYNNIGWEAWGAVLRGPLAFVAGGGLEAVNIDRRFYDVKIGFKARYLAGRVSVTTTPSVFIAMTKRNEAMTPNTDVLYVPVGLGVKLADHVTVALGSGIKGPVSGFAKTWQIPAGISATYATGPVVVGASWVFGALVASAANPPAPAAATSGPDVRVVQAWISYALGGASPSGHAAASPSRPRPASEPAAPLDLPHAATPSWIERDAPAEPSAPARSRRHAPRK